MLESKPKMMKCAEQIEPPYYWPSYQLDWTLQEDYHRFHNLRKPFYLRERPITTRILGEPRQDYYDFDFLYLARSTDLEEDKSDEPLGEKPNLESNFWRIIKKENRRACCESLNSVLVHDSNHDFNRPLFTSFSFFIAGLTKRFPTPQEQRMLDKLLSQTCQPQFYLDLCPGDDLYSSSVFEETERLFTIHECIRYFLEDDETIFHLNPLSTECNKLSIVEAKVHFQPQHPPAYNASNSTSSSIALVHTATMCRKC